MRSSRKSLFKFSLGMRRSLRVLPHNDHILRADTWYNSFTLHRTISNWDTSYLHGAILSLLSTLHHSPSPTRYTVTFPLTHSRVTISAPHKYNSFFSAVAEVFTGTKKYEVVKSVWPYADVERGEEGRRCVVQSEEAWFEDWRDAIVHAVQMRRSGWVTVEDRLEGLMEPKKMERNR